MQQIPRVCAALIVVGFFLPWISADFLGMKIGISGMQFATAGNQMGDPNYFLLFAPIVAAISGFVHTRKGYVTCSLLATGVIFLMGPVLLKAGAAEAGVSRGIGLYICFAGCFGMLITGSGLRAHLPPAVLAALKVDAGKRTAAQKAAIDAHYLSVAPQLASIRQQTEGKKAETSAKNEPTTVEEENKGDSKT